MRHLYLRIYLTVLDLLAEFQADCLGWQYQLGLLKLLPPSDFAGYRRIRARAAGRSRPRGPRPVARRPGGAAVVHTAAHDR